MDTYYIIAGLPHQAQTTPLRLPPRGEAKWFSVKLCVGGCPPPHHRQPLTKQATLAEKRRFLSVSFLVEGPTGSLPLPQMPRAHPALALGQEDLRVRRFTPPCL